MTIVADPEEEKTGAAASSDEKPVTKPKKAATPKRRRAGKAPKAGDKERPAKKERKAPPLKPGHVHVYSLEGNAVRETELPPVFRTEVRDDLIRRAVTAFQANRRQPYGPAPTAGLRHSVEWSGKGHGVSRVPRIRGTMIGAEAPGTVGGRRAHPPRPEKIWARKVNRKERRVARNAALAALQEPIRVEGRGHRFRKSLSLPVVVEDGLEALDLEGGATRSGAEVLERLGLLDDVERAKHGRHVRAGRGKMRGRRYRTPRSLLVVVRDPAVARRAFGNLPGVDVVTPASLNAEVLAPGGHAGRLALFSEGALEVLRSWQP